MPTSILPWLPAIFLAMYLRTIQQMNTPSFMRRVGRVSSAYLSTSFSRRAFVRSDRQAPEKVLVRAHLKYPLSTEQSTALKDLPANQRLLNEKFPNLVSGIVEQIRRNLDKHEVEGSVSITNNFTHFLDVDTRWSNMENEVQILKQENQDRKQEIEDRKQEIEDIKQEIEDRKQEIQALQESNLSLEVFKNKATAWQVVMNEMELYKTLGLIQNHLRLRCIQEGKNYSKSKVPPESRDMRNSIAHALDLAPCLRIVDRNPKWELTFEALFGVSSSEAKALCKVDKLHKFQVEVLLSFHAQLWKNAIADKYIVPFGQWLKAMQNLQSGGSAVSDIERLAEEAFDSAKADFISAPGGKFSDLRKVNSNLRGKGLKDKDDILRWDNIVSDWKKREIWQELMKELDLPAIDGE